MTASPCTYPPNRPGVEGYVKVRSNGRQFWAHRLVWEQANGPIPDGFVVGHTCHDDDPSCPGGVSCPHRACWNIEHLSLMTQRQNVQRGRHGTIVGPVAWDLSGSDPIRMGSG